MLPSSPPRWASGRIVPRPRFFISSNVGSPIPQGAQLSHQAYGSLLGACGQSGRVVRAPSRPPRGYELRRPEIRRRGREGALRPNEIGPSSSTYCSIVEIAVDGRHGGRSSPGNCHPGGGAVMLTGVRWGTSRRSDPLPIATAAHELKKSAAGRNTRPSCRYAVASKRVGRISQTCAALYRPGLA